MRRLLLTALLLAGCGSPPVTLNSTPAVTEVAAPTGAAATATIGAMGGALESADGLVRVEVPAGAFAADTQVSVTPLANVAPGALRSVRLTPDGATFAKPVTLRFRFTPAELAGSTPEALRVASQDTQRRWALAKDVAVDTSAGTVTVTTTHFSDWSLLIGWQLRPPAATVKVNETLTLSARYCDVVEEDGLTGLAAECDEDDLAPLLSDWSVNGVAGGSPVTGTVSPDSASGVYTAPADVPSPETVSVSVNMAPPRRGKVLLVSSVTVVDQKPKLPTGLQGTFTYTSSVGSQFRVSGTGQVSFVPWPEQGPYAYRMSGTFTLTELVEDLPDCVCTATGGTGSLYDQDNGLRYFPDGLDVKSYRFGWSTGGMAAASCSKKTPAANCPSTRPFTLGWSLISVETTGPCTGMSVNSFTEPRTLAGEWSSRCVINGMVTSEESMRWSFSGQ